MHNKVLIIGDDKDINNMLTTLLNYNDYETLGACSSTEGVLLRNESVDLILLDLMLQEKW